MTINWQCEFRFECNLLLANISDQCQLGYVALQIIMDAMRDLSTEAPESNKKASTMTKSKIAPLKLNESKQSKLCRKGVYQFFDLTSKSHLNSRL